MKVEVTVMVPSKVAWSYMKDFSLAHKYVPGIVKTEVLEGPSSGIDAHRLVFDKTGKAIDETIVEWIEGSGFKIQLHQGDKPLAPFKYAQFNYHMCSKDEDSTLVELAMVYQIPWGFIGRMLGKLIFRPVITNRVVGVAAGLKAFYENADKPNFEEDSEHLRSEVRILTPT